jgi:hypothetical protein
MGSGKSVCLWLFDVDISQGRVQYKDSEVTVRGSKYDSQQQLGWQQFVVMCVGKRQVGVGLKNLERVV